MLIKVCGMRDADNIAEVEKLGIDLMGFIFYEKSPRYVSEVPRYLPSRCARVGVFVNSPLMAIVSAVGRYSLDYIQLHGDESPEYVRSLRDELRNEMQGGLKDGLNDALQRGLKDGLIDALQGGLKNGLNGALQGGQKDGIKIIRAVRVQCPQDAENASAWEGIADILLFETASASFGGSGQSFDWDMLYAYKGSTPFLIAGGIGPESAQQIKAFHHPAFLGVDLNSRFETAPALKDSAKLKNFINDLK